MSSSDEMVDNVRRGRVATGTAKPLAARQALNNAARVMDTAISVRVSC